ncbi:hypothetical protein [Tardiphaga sp. 862_B3_N1_1]|uniref:hypothetical protein n=1 Tax=Tardiphaga sp. 862_B3_N1_1 TaxID=3240763 RepID=UPI003F8A9146
MTIVDAIHAAIVLLYANGSMLDQALSDVGYTPRGNVPYPLTVPSLGLALAVPSNARPAVQVKFAAVAIARACGVKRDRTLEPTIARLFKNIEHSRTQPRKAVFLQAWKRL